LQGIRNTNEKIERVMLVGHNPTVENVTGALIGSGGAANLRMPTAALVCLNTYVLHWEQVQWGTCQLNWMMIPKVLKKVFG